MAGKKRLSGVKSAVKRTAKKLTARLRPKRAAAATAKTPRSASPAKRAAASRRRKVETDISDKALRSTYTPTQTSLKAPFRSSGADRQRDQDVADQRWNDEDRITNKSGDPRIGTHRRKYEPGE